MKYTIHRVNFASDEDSKYKAGRRILVPEMLDRHSSLQWSDVRCFEFGVHSQRNSTI